MMLKYYDYYDLIINDDKSNYQHIINDYLSDYAKKIAVDNKQVFAITAAAFLQRNQMLIIV